MFLIPLATSATLISTENFWTSAQIYHERPHLVNRKILSIIQCCFCHVNLKNGQDITDIITSHGLIYDIKKIKEICKDKLNINFLKLLIEGNENNLDIKEISTNDFENFNNGIFLSLQIVLPRQKNCEKCVVLVILDKNNNKLTFFVSSHDINLPTPHFPYQIELSNNFLRVCVSNIENAETSSAEWLAGSLFDKLNKWAENTESNANIVKSLTHVQLDTFAQFYLDLKEKYAKSLVTDWEKITKTNPQKFVFEDISIAAYLLSLWKLIYNEDAKSKVKFVDCGCGNGLLVNLLSQEGFDGFGIDLRKRNVWDIFTKSDLKVGSVTPLSTFPESTWLIGNHSDELTPWLPVIASKSSTRCNYFVIPCCSYDFSGKKFVRTNTSLSQYADYINYIQNISRQCGFETKIDKLRIPSTKRTCLIGIRKDDILDEHAEKYINEIIENTKLDFKERLPKEVVRNCTQIDRSILQKIINHIVTNLISNENFIKKNNQSVWNQGGKLHLSKLCDLLSHDDKKYLKNECGGLQTLIRNHRYLFELTEGMVFLRLPLSIKDSTNYRDKPCWFYKFHPNGCLYESDMCGYQHI